MTTKEMADVMLASASGKRIQVRANIGRKWEDAPIPRWDWIVFEYRVKPEEPREDFEPDCTQCVHFDFGKDKRDITCRDCKWNYDSQFELEDKV